MMHSMPRLGPAPARSRRLVATATPPDADITRPAPGTLLGSTLLVAGTTVGAGVLALPAKTLAAGFAPTAATLLGAWVYMASSGLLIAEVNVNTLCSLDRKAVSLSSMAEETLGRPGAIASSVAYAFIHYTLLVAYILQGGTLLLELLGGGGGVNVGAPAFAAALTSMLVLLRPAFVEAVNSVLVVGVVVSFLVLLGLGSSLLDPSLLAHVDVPAVVPAIPVMVLSLVYHNVVPTICYQLGCDMSRIRLAVVGGSLLPTLMFIAWSGIILGTVPYDAASAAASAGETFDPLQLLRASGDGFGEVVRVFSLLAITTSFVGFYYGLTDFFADALGFTANAAPDYGEKEEEEEEGAAAAASSGRPWDQTLLLSALTVLPPLGVALYDPTIFFEALDNAGTYGILTLFGIIPAAMAWSQRYSPESVTVVPEALPGGKASLALMMGSAGAIIGVETWERVTSVL